MAARIPLGLRYVTTTDVPAPIEHKLSIYQGPCIPLSLRAGGRFVTQSLRELIRSSILMILGTPIGTYIHEPNFGSAMSELLFEPNDQILKSLAERYVIDAVSRWEPRVEVISAGVQADEHDMTVTMHYMIKELSVPDLFQFKAARFSTTSSLRVVTSANLLPGQNS